MVWGGWWWGSGVVCLWWGGWVSAVFGVEWLGRYCLWVVCLW